MITEAIPGRYQKPSAESPQLSERSAKKIRDASGNQHLVWKVILSNSTGESTYITPIQLYQFYDRHIRAVDPNGTPIIDKCGRPAVKCSEEGIVELVRPGSGPEEISVCLPQPKLGEVIRSLFYDTTALVRRKLPFVGTHISS